MPSPILQFKRGAVSNLPGLRAGEPALTTDTFDLYVGIDSTTNNNKFFGSHRYWTKETATTGSGVRFVERTDGGTDYIELKAPNTALAGITTYTLPAAPTDGYFLKTNATGELVWASVTGNATFDNATLTGVTTITNANIQSGSINSTTIGLTTAAAGSFTNLTATTSNTGITTVSDLYVDTTRVLYDDGSGITLAGIATLDATTKQTLETLLAFDPNDFDTLNVTGIGTFGGLLDANAGLDVTGYTELDDLNVTGFSTFTNAIDADLLGNAGTATSLANGRNIAVSGIVTGTAYFDGTADITIATTIQDNVIGLGTHTYGDYVKDVTGTANQISVSGSGGETASVTLSLPNDVVVGTSLSVSTLKTATIQHSNGTQALTIDTSGNVGVSTNLTVSGNLYVAGTTTQVNTESLQVEDRIIELGKVQGDAPSDTSWDLGILFNYHAGSVNKKSSVYWEHSASRFLFASDVSESVLGINLPDTGAVGLGTTTPQLTSPTFAPIEIGSLWVNDCAGQTQVISCTDGVRNLENITIDAGLFV